MRQITISDGTTEQSFTLVDEEVKALETDMISIYEWIENAIKNKARMVVNQIILTHTDKQPNKLTMAAKLLIIKDLELESAADRNAALED